VASAVESAEAAPTAAPAASAEPSGEATASSAGHVTDARVARATLTIAAEAKDWTRAEPALLDLVAVEPAAFHDPSVAQATMDVAAALEREGSGRADAVFHALSTGLGEPGLELLYALVETRGGSVAGKRAAGLLAEQDVIARASPAVRVAFALRSATCSGKAALLSRAVDEGDGRALLLLETQGRACLGKDAALDAAIKALRARVRAKPDR
jgi:serine/threonine-protein kinase